MAYKLLNILVCFVMILGLFACSQTSYNHGYIHDTSIGKEAVNVVMVGVDTKKSIQEKLGSPTFEDPAYFDIWYYINVNLVRDTPFKELELINAQTLSITFDNNDTVIEKHVFNALDSGIPVTITPHKTYSRSIQENHPFISSDLLKSLFGNLGRFNKN